jgi:hypothetical protein
VDVGSAGQTQAYFARYDGAAGRVDIAPKLIDAQPRGHQLFSDVAIEGGTLHFVWWDSRNDACYDVTRPIGNCADRSTVPALDAFGAVSTNRGATITGQARLSTVTSNPNYEQFDDRQVPFAGDYLWVTALGTFAYSTWTDWRNTVQGTDPRETPEDEDTATADVVQCRDVLTIPGKKGTSSTAWSSDRCPHAGGLDQNIYGGVTP